MGKVIDRFTPRLDESMRLASAIQTSYALSGICKSTMIVNLPGFYPQAAEYLSVVIDAVSHELNSLRSEACRSGMSIGKRGSV